MYAYPGNLTEDFFKHLIKMKFDWLVIEGPVHGNNHFVMTVLVNSNYSSNIAAINCGSWYMYS